MLAITHVAKGHTIKRDWRCLISEHSEQVALFNWAKVMEGRHPQLKMMFAIPNGGLRNIRVAMKLKKEGVKAGIPDIFLAVPRHLPNPTRDVFTLYGLFIEMKFGKNKTSRNQQGWIEALIAEGYAVEVCYSFEEAKQAIIGYLGLEVG